MVVVPSRGKSRWGLASVNPGRKYQPALAQCDRYVVLVGGYAELGGVTNELLLVSQHDHNLLLMYQSSCVATV